MHRFIIAMSPVVFAVAAQAQQVSQTQEPFKCANPDVLNSLVFNARPEARLVVKRTMPEDASGFRAPADFTLIGNGVRGDNISTVVAHKTELEAGKAFDALLSFLMAEGWRRETTQQGQLPTVTVAGPLPLAARLCRNGERRNMLVQEIAGVRYSTVFSVPTNPPRACNVPAPQQRQNLATSNPMAAMTAAQALMPQLSFPETARMAASGYGNISGGGMTSTSSRIESPDSAASLAGHLAPQLTAQGWRSDAEWNGALSTGSTWSRKADDGQTYWGTLEVLGVGKGVYEVGFSIARRR